MKTKDAPNVRQRILDTAGRLFYQQGYPLTGINQLIAEAGVAKASLYQHFRTKDDILLAYLQQTSQQWFAQVEQAIATAQTPRAQVLAVFDMLSEFVLAVDFRGCNFQNALVQLTPEETEIRSYIQQHKNKMRNTFLRLLEQEPLTDEINLLFEGALISSQIQASREPVATARRLVERLL